MFLVITSPYLLAGDDVDMRLRSVHGQVGVDGDAGVDQDGLVVDGTGLRLNHHL